MSRLYKWETPHVATRNWEMLVRFRVPRQRLYEKGKTMGSPFPEVDWSRLLPGATSFFGFPVASNDRGDIRKQRKSHNFYNDPIVRTNFLMANTSLPAVATVGILISGSTFP